MKYFSWGIWVALISMSCTSQSIDQVPPTKLFENKIELEGKPLLLASDSLYAPLYLAAVDSFLIVHGRFPKNNETYLFKILNRNTGKILNSFGRVGRGPDEFFYPSFLSRVPDESRTIGIYNPRLFSFIELSIDSILTQAGQLTITSYKEFDVSYSKLIKMNQSLFVGTGYFSDGRYALTDTSRQFFRVSGNYPFEEMLTATKQALDMAFQSQLRRHPDQPLLVSATTSSANLEILKLKDHKLDVIAQVNSYPPVFENTSLNNSISISYNPESRWGYQDITVTEKYIYALYSGKEKAEDRFYFGDQVLVFNWKGKPIVQFNLDNEVSNITVDASDQTLYALTRDDKEETLIMTFQIGTNLHPYVSKK